MSLPDNILDPFLTHPPARFPDAHGYAMVRNPFGGQWCFRRCLADVFTDGVLTLTSEIDGHEREFQAGEWVEAVVYDKYHHIVYALQAKQPH